VGSGNAHPAKANACRRDACPSARLSAQKTLVPCDLKSKNTAKIPNTANTANAAFGIPPKTRYNQHRVNDKLTAPPRFGLGQEPVPARFHARAGGFCSYFHLFPLNGPLPRWP